MHTILARPTLYIGLGGSGGEVLLELRKNILNNIWSSEGTKVKLDTLADFPLAQFVYYDLDTNAFFDNNNNNNDLPSRAVKFTDEEKILGSLDLNKYSRSADALDQYPNIKKWLPLNPPTIQNLWLDTSKGAGQIRAISRLYFFDQFSQIREKIAFQLKKLKANSSEQQTIKQLDFTYIKDRIRIVIVASTAGGTGSGAFLDMGWLVKSLAESEGIVAEVDLMLLMPTAYAGAKKDRTQANAYAALMELEAAMRGNKANAGSWDTYDHHKFGYRPFDNVYLLDSINLAQKNTNNIKNIYHMLAETLFDEFASTSFARRIQSIAINQAQFRNNLYKAPTVDKKFNQSCFTYSKAYSSMGRSVLDTKITIKQELQANTLAGEMLKAYFLNQSELNSNNSDVIELMAAIENKNTVLQARINSSLCTSIYIDSPPTPIAKVVSSQLVDWATVALNELGNTPQIAEMLSTQQGRGQIITKVLKIAENQLLAVAQVGDDITVADPLIEALEQMSVAARAELFRKWIACAMPWVDANLAGDFALIPDQYKCFIGVPNDAEFKRKFGDELNSCVPTNAGITAQQLNFVDVGAPGKAVCYIELSGLPLPKLRCIDSLRSSYHIESEKMPLHTHIDSTQFSHVAHPSISEIAQLMSDFKYYLIAVMTGILTRSSQKLTPAGQYEFALTELDIRLIGNERSIRQNGLPSIYRDALISRVNDLLANAEGPTLVTLYALASYYEFQVYTRRIISNDWGVEEIMPSFANNITQGISFEFGEMAKQKGLLAREIEQITDKLLEPKILNSWAKPIPESNTDAYDTEVREADEITGPRLKYVINSELLELGRSSQFIEQFFILDSTKKNSTVLPPPLPLD